MTRDDWWSHCRRRCRRVSVRLQRSHLIGKTWTPAMGAGHTLAVCLGIQVATFPQTDEELSAQGSGELHVLATYVFGDGLVSETRDGVTRYVIQDGSGDTRVDGHRRGGDGYLRLRCMGQCHWANRKHARIAPVSKRAPRSQSGLLLLARTMDGPRGRSASHRWTTTRANPTSPRGYTNTSTLNADPVNLDLTR